MLALESQVTVESWLTKSQVESEKVKVSTVVPSPSVTVKTLVLLS